MENVHFVTNYIINKGSNSLEIIKTVDNDLVLKNNYGFFRCYKMIKNTSAIYKSSCISLPSGIYSKDVR